MKRFIYRSKELQWGKKMAPSYANIYTAEWEETLFTKCKQIPYMYYRYLEDIFGVWHHTLDSFKDFVQTMNSHLLRELPWPRPQLNSPARIPVQGNGLPCVPPYCIRLTPCVPPGPAYVQLRGSGANPGTHQSSLHTNLSWRHSPQ